MKILMRDIDKYKIFKLSLLLIVSLLANVSTVHSQGEELGRKNRAEDVIIQEIELKAATVQDAVRVISELTGVNIVATEKAGSRLVTIYVRSLSVTDVVDSICRIAGLWYRYNEKTGIFIVMTTAEYQKDIVVFRDEPTKMFRLKYLNVGIVGKTIQDLFGERVELDTVANNYLGDDYQFSIESDLLGGGGGSVSYSNSNSNDNSGSGREVEQLSSDKNISLTSSQMSILDELNKRNMQRISDSLISQVLDRSEAPIYLSINRLHNMLFVRTADSEAMKEINKLIKESDLQVPEVLLEMKVIEVKLSDDFKSAFDLSVIASGSETGPDDGQVLNPLDPTAGTVGGALLGTGTGSIIEGSTFVFQALSDNIRARLQLLESTGNTTTLATPMLLASNNQAARLFIGEEAILTTGYESQTVTVSSGDNVNVSTLPIPVTETRDIGNTLTVLPSINADSSVVIRLRHENSSLKPNGASIPVLIGDAVQNALVDTVNTSLLEGTFVAQDGMTVAVGGMIRTSESDFEEKVPILGDIPLLGFFFKDHLKEKIRSELILLITPHVMRSPVEGEAITRKRLGELAGDNVNVSRYLDNLSRERHFSAEGKEVNKIVGAGIPDDLVVNFEESFIRLTQVASAQVRQSVSKRQKIGNINSLPVARIGQIDNLFADTPLRAEAVGSWSDGMHFVTAVELENPSKTKKSLDIGKLKGNWEAVTLELQELGPKGSETDTTYLYLISKKGFSSALEGF